MSYIVCISKDAYKQNNTYYLRKGNTMKKSFVFAAVAATIAASSAMALTEITPTGASNKVDWTGSIGATDLVDVCNFISNTSGTMDFAGTKWTTDVAASVELKQRGATVILVQPDHYVREVDASGAILASGVAHAVNVDYTPNSADGDVINGAGSQVTAYIQDATNPQQLGNTATLIDANTTGVHVKSFAGSNSGTDVVSNNPASLVDSAKANLQILGEEVTSTGANLVAIPFNQLKLEIGGTATLVNSADEALLKNGASYAITHTVTCLK